MADELAKMLPPWVADRDWPTTVSEKNRLRVKPERVFKSNVPTSRERMIYALARYYNGGTKGEKGFARANQTMNFLDWTPVGMLNDMYDSGRAIGEGRYLDAAITGALAIVPGPGDELTRNIKRDFNAAKQFVGDSLSGFKPKQAIEPIPEESVIRKAKDYEIYNPPDKPQQPFELDYPNGAKSDAAGNLLEDMDGRPLTGKQIIGRQTVGGPNVGASPAMDETLAKDISGNDVRIVPRQNIDGGAHGVSYFDDVPGQPLVPKEIEIADDLPQPQREMVIGHEVAHFIDEVAGQIPTNGLDDELRFVYNTTATGRESVHPAVSPESMGYAGANVPRELMAEAIRTYRVNPNWFKTVAPRTAARIREWAAKHPELVKHTQFNSLLVGAGGLALAGQSEESGAGEPPGESRRQQTSAFKGPYSLLGPPVPFELANGAAKAGSYGRKQIVDALVRRGVMPPARSSGKFASLVRALSDTQTRQKASLYGGPR